MSCTWLYTLRNNVLALKCSSSYFIRQRIFNISHVPHNKIANIDIPSWDLRWTPCNHNLHKCSKDWKWICLWSFVSEVLPQRSRYIRTHHEMLHGLNFWIITAYTLGAEVRRTPRRWILLSTRTAPQKTFHIKALIRNGVVLFQTKSVQSFLVRGARNIFIYAETLNLPELVNVHSKASSMCSSITTRCTCFHCSSVRAGRQLSSSLNPSLTVMLDELVRSKIVPNQLDFQNEICPFPTHHRPISWIFWKWGYMRLLKIDADWNVN